MPGKTEIIPTAPDHLVSLNVFTDFEVNQIGNFYFLGAPFGSQEYCTNHTQKRVSKAVKVLELAAEMEDRPSALHIVRDCLSYFKISYATRVVPFSTRGCSNHIQCRLEEDCNRTCGRQESRGDQLVAGPIWDQTWGVRAQRLHATCGAGILGKCSQREEHVHQNTQRSRLH